MLDKILMFIKERLVALNTAINGVSNRVSNLDTRVSNNADVTNRNSSRISNLESDTGWQLLTRSTNWNGAEDYCKYRKVGNIVEIRFYVTPKSNFSAANGILLAYDMPDSIIPRGLTVRSMAINAGDSYMISIAYKGGANEGKIRVTGRNALTQGNALTGQVTYIV